MSLKQDASVQTQKKPPPPSWPHLRSYFVHQHIDEPLGASDLVQPGHLLGGGNVEDSLVPDGLPQLVKGRGELGLTCLQRCTRLIIESKSSLAQSLT